MHMTLTMSIGNAPLKVIYGHVGLHIYIYIYIYTFVCVCVCVCMYVCIMSEICSSKMNPSINKIVYSIDFHIRVGLKTKLIGDIFQFLYLNV